MILVKQEQVWEYISEDEKDDIVLLSVESSDNRSYVESLFGSHYSSLGMFLSAMHGC